MSTLMPRARLLPATIFAIAALLVVKSAELLRAVAPFMLAVPSLSIQAAAQAAARDTLAPSAGKAPPGEVAAAPAPVEPKPEQPTISDSERAVLLELRQRRQELDARETALATRESVLGAAERKVAARVEELQTLQTQLQQLDAARHEHEEAGWQGLVKLYENMKPRDAATIMNELDMPVLLQVLDRMKELKAAPILSAMKPDKAREVTDGLAKMRVRTATNAAPGG
jgi:flagellar motility protein MotE (MotC chaperone)